MREIILCNSVTLLSTLNWGILYCVIHQVHATTWHVRGILGENGLKRVVRWLDSARVKSRNTLSTDQTVKVFRQLALLHRRSRLFYHVSFFVLFALRGMLFQDRRRGNVCLCNGTMHHRLIENRFILASFRYLSYKTRRPWPKLSFPNTGSLSSDSDCVG